MLHIEPPKNRGCSAGDSYHMAVNAWLRIFLYGLHGFFDEIVFTSLFNFVESNFLDWKFRGHSSLWSFFQYGFGSFVVEQMYLTWKDKWYLPMPVRGVLYVIWVYLWEFSWGVVLRHFNACPWDYSNRQWNVYGLITLQYFPVWYVASLYQELLSGYLLTLFQRSERHRSERFLMHRKLTRGRKKFDSIKGGKMRRIKKRGQMFLSCHTQTPSGMSRNAQRRED